MSTSSGSRPTARSGASGWPGGPGERLAPPAPRPAGSVLAGGSPRSRGLPLLAAAALAVAVAGGGAAVDLATGSALGLPFAVCLVAGCALAAAAVSRSHLLAVAFLPPLVALLAAIGAALLAGTGSSGAGLNVAAVRIGIELVGTLVLTAPALVTATGLTALIAIGRALAGRRR